MDQYVKEQMEKMLKERNEAITMAITEDDWSGIRRYCEKYDVQVPPDERVMKAGVYKAVFLLKDIPEELKVAAFKSALTLGFNPFV